MVTVSDARISRSRSTASPGAMVRASDPECRATTGPDGPGSSAPSTSGGDHCQSAVPEIRKS